MKSRDVFRLAFCNVGRGRGKTILCALSICVGIFCVCTMAGLGASASDAIVTEIDNTGLSGIALYGKKDESFSLSQLKVLSDVDGIEAVMPLSILTGTVRLRTTTTGSAILGINESLGKIFHLELLWGRLPSRAEVSSEAKVAVIDQDWAKKIYNRENVVGKPLWITIDGVTEEFSIIGIIRSQKTGIEGLVGSSLPIFTYVPYTAVQQMTGKTDLNKLVISCSDSGSTDKMAVAAASILSRLNEGIEVSYENLSGYVDTFKQITHTVSIFVSAVAAISILVGGIGVMNSMVSAAERRTEEIGIYLALGASRGDILRCFLWESVFICLIGGITGCGLSWLGFFVAERLTGLPIHPSATLLLYGLLVAGGCGVLFGILPAVRAARLNPIEAIRHE